MKFYGHCPGASMHMEDHPELRALLDRIIKDTPIEVAIETGTYLGTGSTRFIADAFVRVREPTVFYTIEANHEAAMTARKNLAPYAFVVPIWGSSVDNHVAEQWLKQDEALAHPERYPDIWTDHMSNAVEHYAAEVRGSVDLRDRPEWAGERMLEKLLAEHRDDRPLVILDSAGGIGQLEFDITLREMQGKPYHLLLDDVGHVKHFRSLAYMREHPEQFTILGAESKWALAGVNQ
jgi:hypothetical protein